MGEGAGLIYFVQPSTPVTTWRSLWPAEELRRRGYEVAVDTMDAGYVRSEPPRGALTVVHLTPSLWVHDGWKRRVEAACENADRLVMSLDDDWT